MCFVWISEQTAISFPYTTLTDWFCNRGVCLLRGTDWVFKYNSAFCPHSVFMCFVWIPEQKAILFAYTTLTDWFCNREGVCLLRGTS
jgi:hypothetical protein